MGLLGLKQASLMPHAFNYVRMEWSSLPVVLLSLKQASLMSHAFNYVRKRSLYRALYYKIFHGRNLQMFQISQSLPGKYF
jgi:hypothetical protein